MQMLIGGWVERQMGAESDRQARKVADRHSYILKIISFYCGLPCPAEITHVSSTVVLANRMIKQELW